MYDSFGRAKAFGAAVDNDATLFDDVEDDWTKSVWYVLSSLLSNPSMRTVADFPSSSRFKLHLRPSHLPLIEGLELAPLPAGKTVDDVFADFLGYVKRQVQDRIHTDYAEGEQIWLSLAPTMDVILTTPNGWELEQQQRLRTAAERAGLVSGEDCGRRVRFVTEAEVHVLENFHAQVTLDLNYAQGRCSLCDWHR
jgi:hypothetical protein